MIFPRFSNIDQNPPSPLAALGGGKEVQMAEALGLFFGHRVGLGGVITTSAPPPPKRNLLQNGANCTFGVADKNKRDSKDICRQPLCKPEATSHIHWGCWARRYPRLSSACFVSPAKALCEFGCDLIREPYCPHSRCVCGGRMTKPFGSGRCHTQRPPARGPS